MQDAVCRQTYSIFDPFGFEKLVDLGIGKAGVGSEINERDLAAIARHDRLQNLVPAICSVDVAGTKRAPFEVAELVEQKQRMVAGAGIMAVPDFTQANRGAISSPAKSVSKRALALFALI